MEIGQDLLFFFSALGVFNGFLLGLYFLFKARPRHYSNYFLAFFFLSLSIRIGKSVVFYFDSSLAFQFLQLGLMFCCFIGPALYLYVRSITSPLDKKDQAWKLHLGILVPLVLLFGFLYPYHQNVTLWRQEVVNGIYLIWAIYTLLSLKVGWPLVQKIVDKSRVKTNRDRWAVSLLVGNAAILTAYIMTGITSYILGALLFSFLLYSVILILFKSNKRDSILVQAKEFKLIESLDDETKDQLRLIEEAMVKKELFLNADLKLANLANEVKLMPHLISKLLNDYHGQNFSHYLNMFRIERAKELILSDSSLTLEALGYDSGFNSKSSFFATFKKFTGQTPSKFKEHNPGKIQELSARS